jgi:hypothetical protein
MQRLRVGADAQGKITGWDHIIASCSRNVYRKDPRAPYSTESYGSYVGRVQSIEQLDADLLPTRIPTRGCAMATRHRRPRPAPGARPLTSSMPSPSRRRSTSWRRG